MIWIDSMNISDLLWRSANSQSICYIIHIQRWNVIAKHSANTFIKITISYQFSFFLWETMVCHVTMFPWLIMWSNWQYYYKCFHRGSQCRVSKWVSILDFHKGFSASFPWGFPLGFLLGFPCEFPYDCWYQPDSFQWKQPLLELPSVQPNRFTLSLKCSVCWWKLKWIVLLHAKQSSCNSYNQAQSWNL